MSTTTAPLTPNTRVLRKAGVGSRPIIGTVTEMWTDRRGRARARVHWQAMQTGTARWGTGSTDIYSNLLCSSLVVATPDVVATRQAAYEAAVTTYTTARNAKRAGTAYPLSYGVFNITDGSPRKVGRPVGASTPDALTTYLRRYEQAYPDHRFAILAYRDRWDDAGEKTVREWMADEMEATA